MELLFDETLEIKPVSVNSAYNYNPVTNRRFLNKDAYAQKLNIGGILLQKKMHNKLVEYRDKQLRLEVTWYSNRFLTKGYPKTAKFKYSKLDISDILKNLEDTVYAILGVDDSQNFTIQLTKIVVDTSDKVNIKIFANDY